MSHHRMTRANMFGHVRPLLGLLCKIFYWIDDKPARRYCGKLSVELRIIIYKETGNFCCYLLYEIILI